MNQRARKPAYFRLDDPGIVITSAPEAAAPAAPATKPVATPRPARAPRNATTPKAAPAGDLAAAVTLTPGRRDRRVPWGSVFWASAGGLVLLWMALGVADLVRDLFGHSTLLGALGGLLAAVAGVALSVVAVRETIALVRLSKIEHLQVRAAAVLVSDDRADGRALGRDLIAATRRIPRLSDGRMRLEAHFHEIIDGADLVRLAERELLAPLDEEARRLISAAAKRVSVVTAVSPRAAIDMVFVLVTALGLIRRLALLYGTRPGTFGLFRLTRIAITHLAWTGGMAASDSLIQQVIGHGLAAKLSARLGEGILNGLLTARLGLAALEATRPLPFVALRAPTLNDLAGSLLRGPDSREEQNAASTDAALPRQ